MYAAGMSDPDTILTIVAGRQTEFAEEASGVIRLPARWWRLEPATDQTSEASVAAVVALSRREAEARPGADPDPGPEAA
jgi:hypothetical protein